MSPNVTNIIRIVFGVFCLVFGLNKFIGFIPLPPIEGDGGELMRIYAQSGFMKFIGILEIVFGLLLIIGKYIPLATTVLGAIMVNALVFHLLHDLGGAPGAIVGCMLTLAVTFGYREQFRGLFTA